MKLSYHRQTTSRSQNMMHIMDIFQAKLYLYITQRALHESWERLHNIDKINQLKIKINVGAVTMFITLPSPSSHCVPFLMDTSHFLRQKLNSNLSFGLPSEMIRNHHELQLKNEQLMNEQQ